MSAFIIIRKDENKISRVNELWTFSFPNRIDQNPRDYTVFANLARAA